MRIIISTLLAVGLALAVMPPASAQDDPVPRAKPIGNPGAWIPANGYPPAAAASQEEGRVGFMLTIDETGRVSDCKVTSTSESPLLDETTCNYMIANGRFTPPRDKKNKPVMSQWSSSVTWKLETPPPPPATAGAPAVPPPVAPAKR